MSGIRYIDVNQLPDNMSEDNRQFVMQLMRSAPKPTFLLMIHPEQYAITADTLKALQEEKTIPADMLKEIALLKGQIFEEPELFLFAIEGRIGQKDRARYDTLLLKYGLHPLSGQLVPAETAPLSTKALELIIGAVHKVLSQILTRNSNSCQCWREYALLEEQKMDLIEIFGTGGTSFRAGKMLVEQGGRLLAAAQRLAIDDPEATTTLIQEASKLIDQGTRLSAQAPEEAKASGNLSKTAFDKKLTDIDRIIQVRWGKDIPFRYAEHLDQGPCPHCRKPRQLDETLTLGTPEFLHNLFNIALGGEMPLVSILPFVESVFSQIYNPDMIPEPKKKDMAAFTEKIQLQRILDLLLTKTLGLFGIQPMMPPSPGASTKASTKPDSIATSLPTGDSPRMTLTPDFRPASEIGSTTNTPKESDNAKTNSASPSKTPTSVHEPAIE